MLLHKKLNQVFHCSDYCVQRQVVHIHHENSSSLILLKKAAGIQKGSSVPNKTKVGKLTRAQLEEIATTKEPDLTGVDLTHVFVPPSLVLHVLWALKCIFLIRLAKELNVKSHCCAAVEAKQSLHIWKKQYSLTAYLL